MRAVLILTDINIIIINFLPLQHVSNSKIQLWKLKAGILEITDISFVFGSVVYIERQHQGGKITFCYHNNQ